MATVENLIDQIWEHLGENHAFYPQAEIILNGINPAQNLLCLLRPDLLTQRVIVSLVLGEMFIDLRQVAPRLWSLERVIVGNVTGDTPVTSNGELYHLNSISLTQLSRRRDWWTRIGRMENYWRHGRYFLGIYPRPSVASTLTLAFRAIPTAFRDDQFDGVPDIAQSWHTAIGKVGAALLLLKEGGAEHQKAMRLLTDIFGEEPLRRIQKALERLQRQTSRIEENA